jgi:hypothetical protein
MAIDRFGTKVVLRWPQAGSNDFYLQFTTNLSTPISWRNATNAVSLVSSNYYTTNDIAGRTQFFRLQAWEVLFDGTSTGAFRADTQTTFPSTNLWVITTNSELMTVLSVNPVSIITRTQYADFELVWEWKASTNGNSGVFYRATEGSLATSGPEYQLLDDAHNSYPNTNQKMGAVYGLIAPTNKVLVPTGEYNQCRLTVQSNRIDHWLNGRRVVEYELNNSPFTNWVAASPLFSPYPGFGKARTGYLGLQHHGEETWYRNIKLRQLPPE